MQTTTAILLLVAAAASAAPLSLTGAPRQNGPKACPSTTPGPDGTKKCALKAPTDPEFADICHPGPTGHAGGAEDPQYRCPRVNYTDGVFRCACCGAPLFYATSKFQPAGDGWPAFHGNGSFVDGNGTWAKKDSSTVCTPPSGGTEIVCSTCGAHLGDFFAAGTQSDYAYYCIDGVCLIPPGAAAGKVCQPSEDLPTPSKAEAYKAFRFMLQERGAATVVAEMNKVIDQHNDEGADHHHHH